MIETVTISGSSASRRQISQEAIGLPHLSRALPPLDAVDRPLFFLPEDEGKNQTSLSIYPDKKGPELFQGRFADENASEESSVHRPSTALRVLDLGSIDKVAIRGRIVRVRRIAIIRGESEP